MIAIVVSDLVVVVRLHCGVFAVGLQCSCGVVTAQCGCVTVAGLTLQSDWLQFKNLRLRCSCELEIAK